MATGIKPFRAYIYNQEKINDLSRVVSPPYDIISPEKQDYLHKISPHNFTHVDFRKELEGVDRYEAAAAVFSRWLLEKVMVRDEKPAIYFYTQQYTIKGERKTRFGFLALLKLGEADSPVFGHEHTRAAPKEDRLKLIRSVRANLSPIFVIYQDKKKVMEQQLKPAVAGKKSFIDIVDDEKINHRVWKINEPAVLEKAVARMKDENIFIADGHHRYEVSCAYRDELKSKSSSWTGEEVANYILAYFTNINAQGLTVLPIHRIVTFARTPDWEDIVKKLKEAFSVEEIKGKADLLFLLQKAGQREHALGMYSQGRCLLLRLKNIKILDRFIGARSAEYRQLDVAILNTLVFENALGFGRENDKPAIEYTAVAEEAVAAADADPACCAFLLNPTKVDQIVKVALNGEKMPPKSTYFYPKVLSGLVVNKHES